MKKMIKNLMLVAVAAMAFVGCSQVEIEEVQRPIEERYFTLNIETENDVTRTYVDGTEIKWNEQGETIGVLARGYNTETADWGAYNKGVQSSEATLNENIASFTANIPVISDWNNNGIEATQYAVAAFYPYKAVDEYVGTGFEMKLPSTQTPVQGSYDPAADILVSKQEKIFDAVGDNTSVNFKFGRLVSIVEMTVKGIPAGEKISTIEVSASKPLSGGIYYNFIVDNNHEKAFDERFGINGTQGVTLNMNNLEATGEDKVWFTTLPQDLANGSIQVVVKTDVGTYFADIDLSGKQLNLKRADINRFAVTVSAPQPERFVFTEAEAYVTNYGYEGYAYYTVTFKNETSQFTTEFYTHKTAIESGEWLMDSSKADGTLNTNATLNYNAVSTEGKATVVRDGENYTINFTDLYYNNNIIPFTAEFEGTIAINNGNMGAEFVANYTATQWLWLGATSDNWSTNSYAVSGENLSVDLHFFSSMATETSLAEGWYNWVSDGSGMIYSFFPYNFAIKNGLTINGTAITPVSGSAEVIANNETEYTINLTFTDDANNVYKIQYVGAFNVKDPEEQPAGIVFTSSLLEASSGFGDFYINLYDGDGLQLRFNFYNCQDADKNFLPEGTYIVKTGGGGIYYDASATYTYAAKDGEKTAILEGAVVVSESNGAYKFEVDLVTSAFGAIKGTYEGAIEGLILPSEYVEPEPEQPTDVTELTIASHHSIYSAVGQEHEIGFYYDVANSKFVDIDFMANPITAGTYTLDSGLNGYYCKSHGGFITNITVVVTDNGGGNLTFDATFKAGDGNWYHFTYTAQIYS